MRRRAAACLLLLFPASCLTPRFSVPPPHVLREREPEQVLLRMAPGAGPAELQNALARIGGTVIRPLPIVPGLFQVHTALQAEEARARLSRRDGVLAVRPNRFLYPAGSTDGLYPKQWSLDNTGQTITGTIQGTAGADIDAEGAWYFSRGSGFLVAVIDSGVNTGHLDLVDRIAVNQGELGTDPLVDSDMNGYPGDVRGWNFRPTPEQEAVIAMGMTPEYIGRPGLDSPLHGTAVASILSAQGANATTDDDGNVLFDGGMRGVCWYARIVPLQVMESDGGVVRGDVASAIAAIRYCETMGIRVSCNSWGAYAALDAAGRYAPADREDAGPGVEESGESDFDDLREAIELLTMPGDHLFVASAGQSLTGTGHDLDAKPFVPAAFNLSCIISVTGSDYHDGLPADFNHGTQAVDIAAPAVLLVAADGSTSDDYRWVNGTSFATPQVAGAAALLWSYLGNKASAATVKQILLGAARPVSAWTTDPQRNTVTEGVLNLRDMFPLYAFLAPKTSAQELLETIQKMIERGIIRIDTAP